MKQFIYIAVLQLFSWAIAFGQPIVNKRYIIDETTNSIFSSVYSTDSCYYVGGMQTSSMSLNNIGSSWIRFNYDGTIDSLRIIKSDTAGIGFWQTNQIIKTLDGHFATMALFEGDTHSKSFIFIKINSFGDTLLTNVLEYFNDEGRLLGVNPSVLMQNNDSTYYCSLATYREDDLKGATVFLKLDKTGHIIYYKIFYGFSPSYYRILSPYGLTRLDTNKIVISNALIHTTPNTDEKRHHTKLLVVDTLGNLIQEHTYFEDTLAFDCYGLTKTADGGLLYCGRIGRYSEEYNVIGYKAQIVKLNADFSKAWQIKIGSGYTGSPYIGLRNILSLNDSEFVAVGFMKAFEPNDRNQYGWLIKFNIHGEKIWERKYLKVTQEHLAPNYPVHELYDVDITPDGGFVMVGQATNYYEDNGYLPGQKAWLVKTNAYGCLVPGCQINDISVEKPPVELDTTKNPPVKEPITWLYPNPASTNLFYYHHQDNFQYATASIYNAAGEIVQKWEITENDITYDIDVSQLAAGNYYLQVINMLGEVVQTEKFVKI